nr:MAG TPA: hypothetical protein [Caudoviricetes sp.]
MRLAGSFTETEVEDMLPLGNGIGIGYHRIGIERENATGILRLHSRFQQTAIEPVGYLAAGKIEEFLPSCALIQPVRTGNLHATFLLQVHIAGALLADAVRRCAVQLAAGADLRSNNQGHAEKIECLFAFILQSLIYELIFLHLIGLEEVENIGMLGKELHIGTNPYLLFLHCIIDVWRSNEERPERPRQLVIVLYEEIEGSVTEHRSMSALPETVNHLYCLFFPKLLFLLFRKFFVRLLGFALVADSAYTGNLLCAGLLRPPLNTRNYHFHVVSYLMSYISKNRWFLLIEGAKNADHVFCFHSSFFKFLFRLCCQLLRWFAVGRLNTPYYIQRSSQQSIERRIVGDDVIETVYIHCYPIFVTLHSFWSDTTSF